jgi:hypothetical protein
MEPISAILINDEEETASNADSGFHEGGIHRIVLNILGSKRCREEAAKLQITQTRCRDVDISK